MRGSSFSSPQHLPPPHLMRCHRLLYPTRKPPRPPTAPGGASPPRAPASIARSSRAHAQRQHRRSLPRWLMVLPFHEDFPLVRRPM
ncbi:hypothetical protein NL676_011599 [Syzygium grande]|nr:hypothetical protein NL676_011599 [Syzygium grande]